MKMKKEEINPLMKMVSKSLISLSTPSSISYMWNGGSLLGLMMSVQIISGLLVSMHYTANVEMAFESVVHIVREVNMGWLIRNMHANGASILFILMYFHISRGIMFSSFKKKEVWMSGTTLILLTMATAFLGYVLPWGQMSFWGATVITNLLSAIPLVGSSLVQWIWGGFSVGNATLNRFFSLHFFFPFIIIMLSFVHLILLHSYCSSNPTGSQKKIDMMKFSPYFAWKDYTPIILMFISLLMISILTPFILGDSENFNLANPMLTPIHIQPEWYFLFAYAILRAIPNKLGGVVALVMSILMINILMSKKTKIQSSKHNPMKKFVFMFFSCSFLILTWLGANAIEPPFELMSQVVGMIYFFSLTML